VEAGDLSTRRLDSWRKLRGELHWQTTRREARQAALAHANWRYLPRPGRRAGNRVREQ